MVVLTPRSTAYQAARAMADNHIGAVLVVDKQAIAGIVTDRDLALAVLGGALDPATRLSEIMSEEVVTCDIGSDLGKVVELMQQHAIRRLPLVEEGRPVGLVTFDDLVVDSSLSLEELRNIVTAQLEVEAPQKPAGSLHPSAAQTAQSRTRALMRAKARAEATYGRFLQEVADATGLERQSAEKALYVVGCMLCRRLTQDEARDLIAQLPSLLQPRLQECADGPDRNVSTEVIEDKLSETIGSDPQDANRVLLAICRVISNNVSAGQMEEVRGQLPEEMKPLFGAVN
ncbi:DUF2267 domain-containing protein [Chelativorans sp. Marseille-P2723]|uniref:DUF2267 domain-containing protein n=1 Tax=Chelativorans sp. Marseille-P2723 TaxID=2709133 RepID=UPI0015703EC2|nr:DUF2267 domain-containing protein [Chelativorans sp. Marseille-P2723]